MKDFFKEFGIGLAVYVVLILLALLISVLLSPISAIFIQ